MHERRSTEPATIRRQFGTYLRRERRAAGLTQEELARRSGVSSRTVRDLERGSWGAPRSETAMLLADALGLDADARDGLLALADAIQPPPDDGPPADGGRPRPAGAVSLQAMPVPPHPLLGRDAALAALLGLLDDPAERIVTLLGPGGVGKTRLALEAARREAAAGRAVAWVPLEALGAPEEVLPAIARAVGAGGQGQTRGDLVRGIADALGGRDMELLLALDNCEHVIAAAADVSRALEAAPGLRILATSREALRIAGERRVTVVPLPVPAEADDPAEAAANPAVALFVDRAGMTGPAGPALEGARRAVVALDGLPLAIELAAAQVEGMSVGTVASLLDSAGIEALAGGRRDAHSRLRSMDDAVRWSYDLLGEPERRLLRVMAVFRGGVDLALLEDVGGRLGEPGLLRGLPGLVRATLVAEAPDAEGGPRLRILSPIRLFAEAELRAAGEADAAERAHLAAMLAFARGEFNRVVGPEPLPALAAMDRERDNLAAALDRAIRAGDARDALALAAAMSVWWEARGEVVEGARWLDRALALDLAAADPRDVSLAGRIAAMFAFFAGRFDRCDAIAAIMLRAAEEAGYAPGAAIALTWIGDLDWHVRGDAAAARAPLERAVAMLEQDGESLDLAQACTRLGDYLIDRGEPAAALPLLRRAIAIRRARGNAIYLAGPMHPEAAALAALGRMDEARAGLLETARAAHALAPAAALYALMRLAAIDAAGDDPARREAAALLIGAADATLARLRMELDPTMVPHRDQALADLAAALGAPERDRLLAEGRELSEAEALELAGRNA